MWTTAELADRYQAANESGERDRPETDPTTEPIALLATSIPRLISLAVATYSLHILPASDTAERVALADDLLATIDITAAGSLRRCHLALEAEARSSGYAADDCRQVAHELAADLLEQIAAAGEPPAVVAHAQEAGRWVAIAIEALVRHDSSAFAEAIADSLARLLVVFLFADLAIARQTPARAGS